ncbi:hypothetical protein LOD99_15010 [Oopsacas minuta]|uniref:Thioredoxin domain-containing protein n=1 Tax=Oopsacas minuta TaxID=111878 RepID=A0AAV7KE06_9METZ|nr:hypothetical protein LOD99_15010 [Oopsacas minuta]
MLGRAYVRAFLHLRLPQLNFSLIAPTHTNTTQIQSINSFQALSNILQSQEPDKLVLIDFFSNWCPPCRLALSALEKLATEFPDVDIISVDIEEVPKVVQHFDIHAVPKTLFFRNKERVGIITGPNQNRLRRKIRELLQIVVPGKK